MGFLVSLVVSLIFLCTMALGSGNIMEKTSETAANVCSPGLSGITVDKSVEFSYEEFAKATDDFSIDNKIGQGGFGSVHYAELGGEVRCHDLYQSLIHH